MMHKNSCRRYNNKTIINDFYNKCRGHRQFCRDLCILLYRKLRSYTVKYNYIAVQIFLKSYAFQKCTWLKKSDNAPHSRRRRCGEAAFLVSVYVFVNSVVDLLGEIVYNRINNNEWSDKYEKSSCIVFSWYFLLFSSLGFGVRCAGVYE